MIIAIGTDVMKANEPKILMEFGGSLELIDCWAQNVLKNMNQVKRKKTTGTGKVEPSATFLKEERFSFQRAISKFVLEHDILLYLVLMFRRVNINLI